MRRSTAEHESFQVQAVATIRVNCEAAGATTIDGEPIDLELLEFRTDDSVVVLHHDTAGFEKPNLDFWRHAGVEHACWRGAGNVGPACRRLGLLDRALAEDVTT